jgi:hypothetical protein
LVELEADPNAVPENLNGWQFSVFTSVPTVSELEGCFVSNSPKVL